MNKLDKYCEEMHAARMLFVCARRLASNIIDLDSAVNNMCFVLSRHNAKPIFENEFYMSPREIMLTRVDKFVSHETWDAQYRANVICAARTIFDTAVELVG